MHGVINVDVVCQQCGCSVISVDAVCYQC